MTWFPKEQNIPEDCNAARLDAVALLVANSKVAIKKQEDLTFIIPYSADSDDRRYNMGICLFWILNNTRSKVHIHIAETKKNLLQGPGWNIGQKNRKLVYDFLLKASSTTLNLSNNTVDLIDNATGDASSKPFCQIFSSTIDTHHPFLEFNGHDINRQQPNAIQAGVGQTLYRSFMSDLVERVKLTVSIRDDEEPFHRTKYLNSMLAQVKTKYVCVHDADVILPAYSLDCCLEMLSASPDLNVVYPYEHTIHGNYQLRVFRSSATYKTLISAILRKDCSILFDSANPGIMRWSAAYGQSIILRTDFYKSAGGENENFVSWGAEDVERYVRFIKQGPGTVGRLSDGYVIHLEHERGSDSSSDNPHFIKNEELWSKLQLLSREDLNAYYKNQSYILQYGWNVNGSDV